MAPRRSHYKSRRGCDQCKQRRVKCNEERPSCQHCLRRKAQCSFDDSARAGAGILAEASPRPGSETACTPRDSAGACLSDHGHVQPACRVSRRSELHLMHHYSTVTCETMGATPQQRDVWKYAVPKETIKHDFLMDGILSFAAVHYAHLNPPSSGINSTFYITAAMQYQNSGLQGYRAALSSVTRDNFEAVFAFSIILTILGFAMPSGLSASSAQLVSSPTTSLSCIFELLKGVKLTIEDYAEAIRIGMFSPLFNSADQDRAPPAQLSTVLPTAETEVAMERLRRRAEFVARYVGSEMRQVYLSSIDSLEAAFQEVSATKTFNIAIAWPVMASSSSRMIELFNHGDPMALLLWAHYGVLTLCFHDQWWGEGFGVRLVEDLSRRLHELDPEWDSWTEWARLHVSRLQSISAHSRISQSGFH